MPRRTLIIIILLISALSPVFSKRLLSNAEESQQSEYRISVNDLMEIKVYEEPDLTKVVRVTPDGTISFPLLGDIKAVGLTAGELEKKISGLLEKDYMVNPQVSVFIQDYANISIFGQVRIPGSYKMKEGLTLTQAIAIAGGFTDLADTSHVKIIRTVANKQVTRTVDVGQILDHSAADVEVQGNDTIIAEEAGQILVMGQVKNPGSYNLKRGMTVIGAIALAGGLSETAAADGTKVIRLINGKKKVIEVPVGSILAGGDKNRDIELLPQDTVVVPESFF